MNEFFSKDHLRKKTCNVTRQQHLRQGYWDLLQFGRKFETWTIPRNAQMCDEKSAPRFHFCNHRLRKTMVGH